MDNPSPPQIAPDPNLAAEQQQAQNDLIGSLQTETQMDTANIMSRYGTRLAVRVAGDEKTARPDGAL